jgi:hypothetical protein
LPTKWVQMNVGIEQVADCIMGVLFRA